MTDALFVPDGDTFVPTDLTRGPWSPDALHGGPVAALIARVAQNLEPDATMLVTRLTVELLRPVPLVPLQVSATMARPGRKVQVVDVAVSAGGTDIAWGRALRIRTLGGDEVGGLPDPLSAGPVPGTDAAAPPGPESGYRTASFTDRYAGFANGGTELRFVRGQFASPGPAAVWVRLAVPVVAGERPSPLERVAAAADFGNGFGSVLDFERFVFINPDLTVYVTRPAVGEWVCLEAATALGTPGTGVAESRLWDSAGPLGRSLQSLFVDPRD